MLDLVLRDAAGRPVANGEAAVVVVDEAVLALTGYRLPDPLDVFYARRGADVSDHRLRSHVLLARPEELAPPGARPATTRSRADSPSWHRWRRAAAGPAAPQVMREQGDVGARTRPPSPSARAPTSRRSRSSPRASPPTPRAGPACR